MSRQARSDGAAGVVAHLDIDYFFAQAEELRRPELAKLPVAVGGNGPRAVVATANYVARRHGVRSAMPMSTARTLCTELVVVEPDFAWYRELSLEVVAACAQWPGPLDRVGLDELYLQLDTAELGADFDGDELAAGMRTAVRERSGLTASVGVADTALVAKLASEAAKPDGHRWVRSADTQSFLGRHRLSDLGGVGPVTARRLGVAGLVTVADARAAGRDTLTGILGENAGGALWSAVTTGAPVHTPRRRDSASIGVERTLESNVTSRAGLRDVVEELAAAARARLLTAGVGASTVTVKMRSGNFVDHSRSQRLGPPGQYDVTDIANTLAGELFERCGRSDRLVGVTYSGVGDTVQLDLFNDGAAPADPLPHPGATVTHATFGTGTVVCAEPAAAVVRFTGRARVIADPRTNLHHTEHG